MHALPDHREELVECVRQYGSCLVAFSAGVDSTVVAKAAQLALGSRAIAVTAVSPSLAAGELDEARESAQAIGIRHEVIHTREMGNPQYQANAPDRCYHCKTELYSEMTELLAQWGVAVIANGANLDDCGDYRPGMQAASEHLIRSPLIECQLTKADVRNLANLWDLSVWDKPAMPCLSSRIAYGEQVTPERLRMVDAAERYLRERGFREVRVRYHREDLARIELPAEQISVLADPEFCQNLVDSFRMLGFKFVTVDLQGFRSGSLNAIIPIETLSR